MAHFPMLMDMSSLKVLVVGGGAIAAEKLEKLVDFTNSVTVISPKVCRDSSKIIKEYTLVLEHREYQTGDIDGFDIVIVATNIPLMHKEIYKESRGSRVLVNSVDDINYCDFIFPSYLKQGDLTIAFSTSGASPSFAKQIRQHFQKKLPNSIADFLEKMKALRTTMPKGKERMKYFDDLTRRYFKDNFDT